MSLVAFIDTEIEPRSPKVLDIGCIKDNGSTFHSKSIADFINFLKGTVFLCGHNILNHDLKYIGRVIADANIDVEHVIDTLYLSPLLFPTRPYHALLKDDKLQTEDINNPLNDSIKAKDLFYDEIAAFNQTNKKLQQLFYLLLKDKKEFRAFFHFLSYVSDETEIEQLIHQSFDSEICEHANLSTFIAEHPIELAYCLALINSRNRYSITPPWVLKNYPYVERLMFLLRSNPCLTGCRYCNQALDTGKALKKYFGYDSFRLYGGEPLQENAMKAAVANKSILAVFPTGGGKSITFQVPALLSGETSRGLTVVISPLQSLMKDQVDNLEEVQITDAVTINGLLDPIERGKSFERVADGSASLLYISPESLRSKSIEQLLLGRKIARFVIDEAHCFSTWGQDFRVDYLYIGDFINSLRKNKSLEEDIPVSCFTATAKQKVIEDIRSYFKDKLGIELEVFASKASRTNLHYKVFENKDEGDKYNAVRNLIDQKDCPTIVYVSRTKKAYKLAEMLNADGFNARAFHGKMEAAEKIINQNAFKSGEVQIMVATSAFGMGVDKKDVGMVIHYDISDSLENYIQEAGRAGRDENIAADCYVLFNEEDLSNHFVLLNQTKINFHEIRQVWKAIKMITKFKSSAQYSALEIARKAGWDDNIKEIETRVTTAIAALEEAGYLKRKQNVSRVYANSILAKTMQEATDKIMRSTRFEDEEQKENAKRIIGKLISSKHRKLANDEQAESRVDYIADHLGIKREVVINIITLLREEKILADEKDLTAFIRTDDNKNKSLGIVKEFSKIENSLWQQFDETEKTFHIKELNEQAEIDGCAQVSPQKIKTIINFWAIKNWIKRKRTDYSGNHIAATSRLPKEAFQEKLSKRHILAQFIVKYLFEKSSKLFSQDEGDRKEMLVEFSVLELKTAYKSDGELFHFQPSLADIEDALFYLSRIEAIKLEGGFLVTYNKLTIERLELNNNVLYKERDYQKLKQFYENKIQQIHIVGEYAKKMMDDYKSALKFVDDYFQLNYHSFLNKYFPGKRQFEISRNITPAKYRQLIEELSEDQKKIMDDKQSRYIVVAAGPGSGKTKVLVHKLASLLLMEDVKHEQLLMLTFSRAAATEFKKRLIELIGNAAAYVKIRTFHAYCFDLLGKTGTIEKAETIIQLAVQKIRSGDVEPGGITKTVLVIDEAQDMNEHEFELIKALMERNEEMRIIAVGDDDQNIYEFRKASSKYLLSFITEHAATKYELITNYRSKSNLVSFANQFSKTIEGRLKVHPIEADQVDDGKIKIVRYRNGNLIVPLVDDLLSTDLSGTTCVLTFSNEEAFQVAGLLTKSGMHAKLIQSNDGFDLYNLFEIRCFLDELKSNESIFLINDEMWDNAKRRWIERFKYSSKLDVCINLLKDFEATHKGKKYKSDLEVFIKESKFEDFFGENVETILVSTMHKAKGKQFDNVFLLLENFAPLNNEKRRLLYVAMTRAKRNLTIHVNGHYLDGIHTSALEMVDDSNFYPSPEEISILLTHRDIKLWHFEYIQKRIDALISGDALGITDEGCTNEKGEMVLKFSNSFLEQLAEKRKNGYRLRSAVVNFIVYWTNNNDYEMKIILPELHFKKDITHN